MIVLCGPTATGKTALAVAIARRIGGEIISADSRQVYRSMDIGTGKDLNEYAEGGTPVPYHLIDVVEPGYEYNIYEYARDFAAAKQQIESRGKEVVVCGGTGFYIETILRNRPLPQVPENAAFRAEAATQTDEQLADLLRSLKPLHNTTDTCDRVRLLRAIEIQLYYAEHHINPMDTPVPTTPVFCMLMPREEVRSRISARLQQRLQNGMIEEVQGLLNRGLTPQQLLYYGLEYKFITLYLTGEMDYDTMFRKLETAIHQFSKRQMTYLRHMERQGFNLQWIDSRKSLDNRVDEILKIYNAEIK